jgi:hypothetical protein
MFIESTIISQDCYTGNKTKTFTDMDLDIMISVVCFVEFNTEVAWYLSNYIVAQVYILSCKPVLYYTKVLQMKERILLLPPK